MGSAEDSTFIDDLPTCWYVADGTHATPNAIVSSISTSKISPKRVQKSYASLQRRTRQAFENVAGFVGQSFDALTCEDLKPKDELLALGTKSFRSRDECTIVAKSEVERKVNDAVAQFREEQMREREFAGIVSRSVRRTAERERVKEKEREKDVGDDRDRDFFKRRRTWVEQQALETKKEAERLEQQERLRRDCSDNLELVSTSGRVPEDELIFKVLVYLPRSPAFVSEEFFVLGSTPLTALRDAIYCVMDVNVRNVDAGMGGDAAGMVADDRAFFAVSGKGIGGRRDGNELENIVKFYEDRRLRCGEGGEGREGGEGGGSPAACKGRGTGGMSARHGASHGPPSRDDLSAPIVEHLHKQGLACSVLSMENACFRDLGDVSFDKEDWPMLYCHQSCCEHIVKIVDVRIFNRALDARWKQQYPFRIYAPGYIMEHRRVCDLCSTASASQVTFGDKNTAHSPYYWCAECFGKMHVDERGKLLYDDFEMYPYEHGYVNLSSMGTVAL